LLKVAGHGGPPLGRVNPPSPVMPPQHVFKSQSTGGLQRESGTCTIDVSAQELARYGANVNAQTTLDGKVVAEAVLRLRNLTGDCDHHSFMFQYGGHNRHDMEKELAYRLRYPRIYGSSIHSQLTMQQRNQDNTRESSFKELLRGICWDLISYATLLYCSEGPVLLTYLTVLLNSFRYAQLWLFLKNGNCL
jgi:hypothetical protein